MRREKKCMVNHFLLSVCLVYHSPTIVHPVGVDHDPLDRHTIGVSVPSYPVSQVVDTSLRYVVVVTDPKINPGVEPGT